MSNNVRVAVLGAGVMGKNHARIYHELPEVELIAIVDNNENAGRTLANNYGAAYYSDIKALPVNSIDAVSICTPTSTHHTLGLYCITTGFHTLIEKPITTTVEQGTELLNHARGKNVIFMVGHSERFNPAVKRAKEIIDAGELGKITNIVARRVGPFPPRINDVDIAVDLAVHDIDIINYLLQATPDYVLAHKRKTNQRAHADLVDFFLRYGDTTTAYIQTNWITPVKIRKLNITGTEGYIELDYINQSIEYHKSTYERVPATPQNFSDFVLLFAQPLKKEILIEKKEPLKEELKHFVLCVATGTHINSYHALDALSIALRG